MSVLSNTPKRKLRRFQFGLRTLLLLVLLASIGMYFVAVRKMAAKRQKVAVEAVLKDGGWIEYDYQVEASGKWINNAQPSEPTWLRKLFGDDFFFNVVGAGVKTDVGMESLNGLTNLRLVWLTESEITDIGLKQLNGLGQLQNLYLNTTRITDVGTKDISELKGLQTLDLSGVFEITDSGMKDISKLPHLRSLYLRYTPITDAGLEHLKGLSELEQLDLVYTHVTENGVANLQKSLPGCRITR